MPCSAPTTPCRIGFVGSNLAAGLDCPTAPHRRKTQGRPSHLPCTHLQAIAADPPATKQIAPASFDAKPKLQPNLAAREPSRIRQGNGVVIVARILRRRAPTAGRPAVIAEHGLSQEPLRQEEVPRHVGFSPLTNHCTSTDDASDTKEPKRRGPKPDSKPALTRRQELNRQAQRYVRWTPSAAYLLPCADSQSCRRLALSSSKLTIEQDPSREEGVLCQDARG